VMELGRRRGLLLPLLGLAALGCGSAGPGGGAQPGSGGTDGNAGGSGGAGPFTFVCAAGSWAANAMSQADCQAWTVCSAGQFVKVNGSATSDRQCAPCVDGMFSTTINAATCQPASTCAAGTFLKTAASARSDAICAGCASGTFSNEGADSCTAWTTCGAGEYVTNTPSAVVDRTCAACEPGTFSTGNNQSRCQPSGSCKAGTQPAAGSGPASVACTPCAAGEYCPGGAARAAACAGDTWDNDGDPATICVPFTECQPGEYVSSPGSATADRSCTSCPTGFYSTTINQSACCADSGCPAGSERASIGTSASATTCSRCMAGQYCAGGSASATSCAAGTWDDDASAATPCVKQSDCAPGQAVSSAGNATTDRSCSACPAKTYSTTSNAVSCTSKTDCMAGTAVAVDGGSTADQTCVACSHGFSTTTNASSCTPWTVLPGRHSDRGHSDAGCNLCCAHRGGHLRGG